MFPVKGQQEVLQALGSQDLCHSPLSAGGWRAMKSQLSE